MTVVEIYKAHAYYSSQQPLRSTSRGLGVVTRTKLPRMWQSWKLKPQLLLFSPRFAPRKRIFAPSIARAIPGSINHTA